MAAPTLLTAIGKFVVVTIDATTGVTPNTPNMLIGIVEQIGLAVTQVTVGDYVMFQNEFVFSITPDTWALVHEDKINSIITTGL